MPDIFIEAIYRAIGERIAARRRAFSMTQGYLSMKTQLPIGRYELGLEVITIPALITIAKKLGCPVSWLLPEEAPKNEEATECMPVKTVTQ